MREKIFLWSKGMISVRNLRKVVTALHKLTIVVKAASELNNISSECTCTQNSRR